MSTSLLVRIPKPDHNRGFFAETYILSGSGYPKFDWRKGWYEVDAETAEELRLVKNNPQDPYSRPVFQIMTHEEALILEEAERQQVAAAESPHPMPKRVVRRLGAPTPKVKERRELDGWDESDDTVPEAVAEDAHVAPKGPIETADEDDLAEIEELAAEAPKKTPEKAATKRKSTTKKKTAKKAPAKKTRPKRSPKKSTAKTAS